VFFKTCARLGISGRCNLNKLLDQSPLPPGEGGKGADLRVFQNLRSTRNFRSVQLEQTPRSVPSPRGRGGKGADLRVFQNLSSTRNFRSVQLEQTPRSVPSPSGRGGKGGRSSCFSKPVLDSEFQVGVPRTNTSISPLSLRERARVRAAIARRTQILMPY
jgi:hypothetical protein